MKSFVILFKIDLHVYFERFNPYYHQKTQRNAHLNREVARLLSCLLSVEILQIAFHSCSSLSYNRPKASSKASSPHSAI